MEHKEEIVDVITGEKSIIDLSPEKIAAREAANIEAQAERNNLDAKATARAALLAKLGINEDEARLLLE